MPLLTLRKYDIFNIVFQYQDLKRNRPHKGLVKQLYGDSMVICAIKAFLATLATDQSENPVLTEADRKQLITIIRSYSYHYRLDVKGISYATCVTIVNGLIDFATQLNQFNDSAYKHMMGLPKAELALIPLATLAIQAKNISINTNVDVSKDLTPTTTHKAITDLLVNYHSTSSSTNDSWVIGDIRKIMTDFKLSNDQALSLEQKKILITTIHGYDYRLATKGESYKTCVNIVNTLVDYTPINEQSKDNHYKKIMALSTLALSQYSLNDLASIIPKEEVNLKSKPILSSVTPLFLLNKFSSYKAPTKRFKLFTSPDDKVITELKALLKPLTANHSNSSLTDINKKAIITCIHTYRGRLTGPTYTLAIDIVNAILGFKPAQHVLPDACYKAIMALSSTELAERRVVDLATLCSKVPGSQYFPNITPAATIENLLATADQVIPTNNTNLNTTEGNNLHVE